MDVYLVKGPAVTLDDQIGIFVAVNDLYRTHSTTASHGERIIGIRSTLATIADAAMSQGINPIPPHSTLIGIGVKLEKSPQDPLSLSLDSQLRNLDGTPFERPPGREAVYGVTVGQEGHRLICKYGGGSDQLTERFKEQFGPIANQDYGTCENLMFEFFLDNLHLLKCPDDNLD